MFKTILIELALFAVKRLVKYADNEISELTVEDIKKKVGKA